MAGFTDVRDLVGGRAAWTALGLPTEGDVGDRRRIRGHARPVATVGPDATAADVARAATDRHPVPVVTATGVLVGAVDPTVAQLPPDTPVVRLMVPAPGTIRPELRIEEAVAQLRRDGLDQVLVTAVDGTLLGRIITADLHA
jgi:CBS-domain-containing membrane protein